MERLKILSTMMPYAITPTPDNNGSTDDLNLALENWVKAENIKEYRIVNANLTVLEDWKCMIYYMSIAYTP